jgi:hypothetical protein
MEMEKNEKHYIQPSTFSSLAAGEAESLKKSLSVLPLHHNSKRLFILTKEKTHK